MRNSSLRVVIGESRPLLREGLRLALGLEKGLRVEGVAADVRELTSLCVRLRPDVVIVGQQLPPKGGKAAITQLLDRCPWIRPVLLVADRRENDVAGAIRAGAQACLFPDASLKECVRILRRVHGRTPTGGG
jgi:DNA-binding NarL/FixJ family response regulator